MLKSAAHVRKFPDASRIPTSTDLERVLVPNSRRPREAASAVVVYSPRLRLHGRTNSSLCQSFRPAVELVGRGVHVYRARPPFQVSESSPVGRLHTFLFTANREEEEEEEGASPHGAFISPAFSVAGLERSMFTKAA